jgi:hypothetical protein
MAKNTHKGFASLYLVLLTLFFMGAIATSSFLLVSWQQRTSRNTQHSVQAYFAAEAGVEDALLRLKNSMAWVNPISFPVGGGIAQTSITQTNPGIHVVAAQGSETSRIRKLQAVYQLSGTTPEFFYGAHVGAGGLQMDNNSQVIGNVFSNGNIVAESGTQITGSATVAEAGKKIEEAAVGQDAFADVCTNSTITGVLRANTQTGCTFGSFIALGTPPSSVPLPIGAQDIQAWKDAAQAGGTITGGYELDGSDTATLGPKKITGNLEIEDSAVLTLTGTLWVTGNVNVKNSARVKLASSYGAMSGIIVADGIITLENNSISEGSGNPDSYLIYLSTNSANPALTIKNNAIADILYTSQGWLEVQNNAQLVEVTGHGIHLKNNAVITYELGLQDARFTSGPGASFELSSWKEVE